MTKTCKNTLTFNLLVAMLTFALGVAVTSLRTIVSKEAAHECTNVPIVEIPTQSTTDRADPIFTSSDMSRVLSMLNQFVETKAKTRGNTFYVEEVDEEELGGRHMRVYWKEDRSLIFITPPYNPEYFLSDWVYAQRRIDLLKDVVETEEDRGTTNFLVARPWVKKVIKQTVQKGIKITIVKPATQSNVLRISVARRIETTKRRGNEPPHNSGLD